MAFPIIPIVHPMALPVWEYLDQTDGNTKPADLEDHDIGFLLEYRTNSSGGHTFATVDQELALTNYTTGGSCTTSDETAQPTRYWAVRVSFVSLMAADSGGSWGGNTTKRLYRFRRSIKPASAPTIQAVGTQYADNTNENRNYSVNASGEPEPMFPVFAKTQRGSTLAQGNVTLDGVTLNRLGSYTDNSSVRQWVFYPNPGELEEALSSLAITQSGFDSSTNSSYGLWNVRS